MMLLLAQGNQPYWLVPSVTLGAVRAMVLVYIGTSVPWHFRVMVSGHVV
jgi:hypothetical protein